MTAYRDAMVRFPLSHGLLYGYGSTLIGAGRFDESLRFSEAQLSNYPEDVRFHKMRAESYAGLGKKFMHAAGNSTCLLMPIRKLKKARMFM